MEIATNSPHLGGLKASVPSLSLAGFLAQRIVGTSPRSFDTCLIMG